jgi:glycosyltransferase involved in cell wall biosynthesis
MSESPLFPGKLALQQRVLPEYRAPFFDRLAAACQGGLSVFAGPPRPEEAIQSADRLQVAHHVPARNLHLLSGPLYLCLQPGLIAWLEAWDPDALILEANPRYPSNRAAIPWMHRRGRPVLAWGLGAVSLHGLLAGLRRWTRETYLRRFDGLIAYSSRGAEQYRAILSAPVFVAPNAVTPAPPPLPDRPPLAGRPARILFVGRLQARKRIDLLLRACAAMQPSPELVIVGEGPARVDLERLAAQVYPPARFTGAQHGQALDALFDQADLFVLPGTGGLAVQQAMAHGLPVIVVEGDGTQSDLVRTANGWLVPEGDLGALTGALRQALASPERLRAMGRESHRIVAEEINLDSMVRAFVEALNTVRGEEG